MTTRVIGQELDVLRDALFHWRTTLTRRLPSYDSAAPLAWFTLCHRHSTIIMAASLGVPDLAEVYCTKGTP